MGWMRINVELSTEPARTGGNIVRDRSGRGSLPVESTSFVGRRRDIAQVKELLGAYRLVTLTGVGGVGKTRLALRVAGEVRAAFADGVWFVDLTSVRTPDPHQLAHMVMRALGIREPDAGPGVARVTSYLATRHALLVLDNCEHVLPACAALVDGLLRGCAALRVLATSREVLAAGGEVNYPVPPMLGPVSRPRARLAGADAVALFAMRAYAVRSDFRMTKDNHDAVVQLCERLDGLPLAIELAAARVQQWTPRQILERSADRFAVLSADRRPAPVRQQTMRACVEWSFELCSEPERRLWARLSVFAGGFELDAVERVCVDDGQPGSDVVSVLGGLVDKSIVDRTRGDRPRYRMLDIIREFGLERLARSGEQGALRRRHRDWYRQLVARADAEWVSQRQAYWYARLMDEHANLSAAVEFCRTRRAGADAVLDMMIDLPNVYWWTPGHVSDGLAWLGWALPRATSTGPARARAVILAAYLTVWQDEPSTVLRLLDEGERTAAGLHDTHGLAFAAFVRAHAALHRNDLTRSVQAAETGLELLPIGAESSLSLRLSLLLTLGGYRLLAGDHHRAARIFQDVLAVTEPREEGVYRSTAEWGLAVVAWRAGGHGEAERRTARAIRIERWTGREDRYITTLSLAVLAWIAAHRRRYRRAAILLGVIDSLVTDSGRPVAAMLSDDHDACELRSRDTLGATRFRAAFQHGRALPLDDAIAYSLDEPRESRGAPATGGDPGSPLTRREHQVAELVARGLSNKEIAATLVVSQRTAESHVEHVLRKLGFARRAQVAAWVTARQSGQR